MTFTCIIRKFKDELLHDTNMRNKACQPIMHTYIQLCKFIRCIYVVVEEHYVHDKFAYSLRHWFVQFRRTAIDSLRQVGDKEAVSGGAPPGYLPWGCTGTITSMLLHQVPEYTASETVDQSLTKTKTKCDVNFLRT